MGGGGGGGGGGGFKFDNEAHKKKTSLYEDGNR